MTTPDPRARRIAEHRQRIAHETYSDSPAWSDVPEKIREQLTAEAADWLRAAVEAGIAPLADRPTDKHSAVWVDDEGFLWAEYQTSPPTLLSDAAILRLVWASEQCSSKRELEDQGVEFRLLGWST